MKQIFTLVLSLISLSSFCQIYYNFETAAPTSNSYTNINADTVRQGNNNGTTPVRTTSSPSTTSPTNGYSTASGGFNAGAAAFVGGFTLLTSTYFETTLTPTSNNSVSLTAISFGSRSTATGPLGLSVRTSVDNFAADQATFTVAANSNYIFLYGTISVTGVAGLPVTIRIYGYNGTGTPPSNTANWRIDDLTINPGALPVTLSSFTGETNGKASVLRWTTAKEINVKGFSVEKSLNVEGYSEIAFVDAKNTNAENTYTVNDDNVKQGANAYRLKIIDNNGSVKYSQVVVINNKSALAVQVFPNPAVNSLNVTHVKAEPGALLRLLTIQGKLLMINAIQTGAVKTTLSINDLPKGIYLLQFESGGQNITTQFSKQ